MQRLTVLKKSKTATQSILAKCHRQIIGFLSAAVFGVVVAEAQTNFPAPFNTEKSAEAFVSPQEAIKKFSVPNGFNVALFAGEPDGQQPIAMTTDDGGRLWVVEN